MEFEQLDFLSGYSKVPQLKAIQAQLDFWVSTVDSRTAKLPTYTKVNAFFSKANYKTSKQYIDYWRQVTPENDSEIFQRWLFAFMSVHTSWKSNIAGYLAIKDWWKWLNCRDNLLTLIDNSRVGMQNNRVKYISEFAQRFWENPCCYKKQEGESWTEFRNRLKHTTLGLGPAKTSFALEMCYPITAKLCCLDTHMFQAYGLEQTKDAKYYEKLEEHWVDMSNMWNVPPYIARCLYWDTKQGYMDSRYWSHVFEKQQQQQP